MVRTRGFRLHVGSIEVLKLPPVSVSTQAMIRRILRLACLAVALAGAGSASAQILPSTPAPNVEISVPGIRNFAPPAADGPLATQAPSSLTLAAFLEENGDEIPSGLVWRIYGSTEDAEGKLPLLATSEGGTSRFDLAPGTYLVHAAFGRAGATKRVSLGPDPLFESFVLDAGGLKLAAMLPEGRSLPADDVLFSIYESATDANGQRALVVPDVKANRIVRLNAGTYHIVSNYGTVNAVVRSDIRVEAGKLTEATVEHRAAELTMKLVRETGGEALADTSWTILAENGDSVREVIGPYATMVLAEGNYTAVARNRERLYEKDFTVVPGRNQEVEVLTTKPVEEVEVPFE